MKKMLLICLISLVTLSSCGTTYTPPIPRDIAKTKAFQYDYDKVWDKIIEWFSKNGTPIKNLDKSSGFISTESNLLPSKMAWMDCGTGGEQTAKTITINIVVRKVGNLVEVTIDSFMSCHLYYVGWDTGANKRIDCQSTGLLEQEIFEYVK